MGCEKMLCCTLSVLGGITFLYGLVTFVQFILAHFSRDHKDFKHLGLTKQGSAWAVVTGGSDGIGKVFCQYLADKGFNLLILSRTEEKLKTLSAELIQEYSIDCKYLAVDFANCTQEGFWDPIIREIKALPKVGLLINNVGVNYNYPANFLDAAEGRDNMIIDINIKSMLDLTRIVLPIFVENKAGGIINLSSFTGVIPAPMLATYAASKSFINTFSMALAEEYKEKNVYVLSITPGLVVSAMSKRRRPNFMQGVVAPKPVVKEAMAALGRVSSFAPHPVHAAIQFVFEFAGQYGRAILLKMHKGVRKAAMKKEEQRKRNN